MFCPKILIFLEIVFNTIFIENDIILNCCIMLLVEKCFALKKCYCAYSLQFYE